VLGVWDLEDCLSKFLRLARGDCADVCGRGDLMLGRILMLSNQQWLTSDIK
jgi:hypothetical protein